MKDRWAIIATWKFTFGGIEQCSGMLRGGCSAQDAGEVLARRVEDDPEVDSVGFGALPNAKGELELDAGFMNGRDLALGCVLGVQGFRNPVSIARRVMTDCPHTVLIGRGAEDFADAHGFTRSILLTDAIRLAWEEKMKERQGSYGHDTVGVVALDELGDVIAATSTSGLALKLRGRVGDSALVGAGLYADNDVGGATATGVGEDIMRGCTCFMAVELMRQGMHPLQAAEEAVRRTHRRIARHRDKVGNIAVVCANKDGEFGGAANHTEFTYAAASYNKEPMIYAITEENVVK